MKMRVILTVGILALSHMALAHADCGTNAFVASLQKPGTSPDFRKNLQARITDCNESFGDWKLVSRQTVDGKTQEAWLDPVSHLIWSSSLVAPSTSIFLSFDEIFAKGYGFQDNRNNQAWGWTFYGKRVKRSISQCELTPFISDVTAHLPSYKELDEAADRGLPHLTSGLYWTTTPDWNSSPSHGKIFKFVDGIRIFDTEHTERVMPTYGADNDQSTMARARCVGRVKTASDVVATVPVPPARAKRPSIPIDLREFTVRGGSVLKSSGKRCLPYGKDYHGRQFGIPSEPGLKLIITCEAVQGQVPYEFTFGSDQWDPYYVNTVSIGGEDGLSPNAFQDNHGHATPCDSTIDICYEKEVEAPPAQPSRAKRHSTSVDLREFSVQGGTLIKSSGKSCLPYGKDYTGRTLKIPSAPGMKLTIACELTPGEAPREFSFDSKSGSPEDGLDTIYIDGQATFLEAQGSSYGCLRSGYLDICYEKTSANE